MGTVRWAWLSLACVSFGCGSVASNAADGAAGADGPPGTIDAAGPADGPGGPVDVALPPDAPPAPMDSLLVVQSSFMGLSAVSRLDLLTGIVVWSGVADGGHVDVDPDGVSFWISSGNAVHRRSLASGATLDSVPFMYARDLVVVPAAGRLFVAGYQEVGVIDLASRTLVSTIPLMMGDQTLGVSASPAGDEVLVGAFDGSATRLVFINAMASSPSITQDLAGLGNAYDNVHLGVRVLTWDDNLDQLREFTGDPWSELLAHRVTIGGDGGASANGLHNLTFDGGNRACVFRAITPSLVCFQVDNPPNYDTFMLPNTFTAFIFDQGGNGVLGMQYPPQTAGFEHVDFITGLATPSGIDTSGLPTGDVVVQLLRVPTI